MRYKNWFVVVLIFLFLLLLTPFVTLITTAFCFQQSPVLGIFHTVPVKDLSRVDLSYLLITPFVDEDTTVGGAVYLTDLYGKTIHKWKIKYNPRYAELMPNGHILVLEYFNESEDPAKQDSFVEELDWWGKTVWKYDKLQVHHDMAFLPNGNKAFLVTAYFSPGEALKIKGGIEEQTKNAFPMSRDKIYEVDKNGDVVWQWDSFDHLDPNKYTLAPVDTRQEWTHANSIEYLPHNPIDNEEGYLVSFRQISTVVIIRKRDGEVLWASTKGLLDHQHDATLLDNGNILVFDNGGFNRNDSGSIYLGTQVKEIDPKTNEAVWVWTNGNGHLLQDAQFESDIIGGAQRLKNDNTMIVDGVHGHLFEVTPTKEVVWNFYNPYQGSDFKGIETYNAIFKARRYSASDLKLPERLPSPLPAAGNVCRSLYNSFLSIMNLYFNGLLKQFKIGS